LIRSMTAFARRESKGDLGALTWELRSVNHRYLDITLRLPEDLRGLESALRAKVAQQLQRGKLDGVLRYRAEYAAASTLAVNEALARGVIDAAQQIASLLTSSVPITAIDVLRWPGVVQEPEADLGALNAQALALFDAALEDLNKSRASEGARIEDLIRTRCLAMCDIVAQVRQRRPQFVTAVREKLLARVSELKVEPDQNRLEQELAIVAQRLDVEEELDRLEGHLKEIDQVLAREEAVGRRLDFLMQELNREANTLGSKSADLATTQAAVELKVLIEQMREQVQNVE
jgi:uncharacterized protein (TIGR00255 family)